MSSTEQAEKEITLKALLSKLPKISAAAISDYQYRRMRGLKIETFRVDHSANNMRPKTRQASANQNIKNIMNSPAKLQSYL